MKNYFEILGVDENVTSEEVLAEAYSVAQNKWQTILNLGAGDQAREAREIMDGGLEKAYQVLSDPTSRQQYKRQLEFAREKGLDLGCSVQVKFSLGRGYGDYTFMVVENPIRHSLALSPELTISSIQEYICRVWEEPELGLQTYTDRSLERWVHYSAADIGISNALKYFRWFSPQISQETLMFQALDILQSRYPVPILPKSRHDLLDLLPNCQKPQWNVLPNVVNFGLIPKKLASAVLFIKFWNQHPGHLRAEVDNPFIKLETGQLNSTFQLTVSINGSEIKAGESVQASIKIISEAFGEKSIPVLGVRSKWLGNRSLERNMNFSAAQLAYLAQDYETAARTFRLINAKSEAEKAEMELIRTAYLYHQWPSIIEKVRQFHERYGRQVETLIYLVESLRMVGGSHYQLEQYERSLPYLAALAYETSYLPGRKLSGDNWTAHPDAQITLHHDDPKTDWVNVAEKLDLRWTHGQGRADQSKYAGPMPLNLKGRRVVWSSNTAESYKHPIVAYEGILVARSKDNRSIVGLDAASGQVVWRHTQGLTGKEVADPVVGNNHVFVTDPAGSLYALDILTGKIKWQIKLEDSKDLSLAVEGQGLYIGTGTQLHVIDSLTGEILASTDKMKGILGGLFGGANPINLLISDDCCMYQKAAWGKRSLNFLEIQTGSYYEYEGPYSLTPPITWSAYEGEIYMPLLVSKEMRCKYRDSEGKVRERTEIKWRELHFIVYGARSKEILASIETPVDEYPLQLPSTCEIHIKNVQIASACAVAPVFTEKTGDMTYVFPPQEGKPLHRLVAASFGQDVYYWLSTEHSVSIANHRRVDSNVQSIIFANVHDMVVAETSLSTSLVGNVDDEESVAFSLKEVGIGSIIGTPALYGDIIYVLSQKGRVFAIGY